MFDSLFPDAAAEALEAKAKGSAQVAPGTTAPKADKGARTPESVPWFKNFWGALKDAPLRAGAEIARFGTSLLTPEAAGALDQPSMFSAPSTKARKEYEAQVREQESAIRRGIKETTPDPESTGAASMILHELARFGTKAAAYTALGGTPAALAGMTLDEGYNEAARRMDAGMDPTTAAKLGVVRGVATAAALVVPVSGKGIAETLALTTISGPAAYVAETTMAKDVLLNAGYVHEAAAMEPYDPWGLGDFWSPMGGLSYSPFGVGMSFAGALGMAGAVSGVRRLQRAPQTGTPAPARSEPPAPKTPVAQAAEQFYRQEHVDAAHVAILQAQREGSALHAADDLAAAGRHGEALDAAAMQLAKGERVSVAHIAPVDSARMLQELSPLVDRADAALRHLRAAGEGTALTGSAEASLRDAATTIRLAQLDAKQSETLQGDIATLDARMAAMSPSDELAAMAKQLSSAATVQQLDAVQETIRAELTRLAHMPKVKQVLQPNHQADRQYADLLSMAVQHRVELARIQTGMQAGALAVEKARQPLVRALAELEGRAEAPAQPTRGAEVAATAQPAANLEGGPARGAVPAFAEAQARAARAPYAESTAREVGAASVDFVSTESARIEAADPDMLVMMEGMDAPVRAADLLAEARAMAAQEIADAPLMRVAVECLLRG